MGQIDAWTRSGCVTGEEPGSFIMGSEYVYSLLWREILSLLRLLLCKHPWKIIRNEGNQCLCLQDTQKCKTPMKKCLLTLQGPVLMELGVLTAVTQLNSGASGTFTRPVLQPYFQHWPRLHCLQIWFLDPSGVSELWPIFSAWFLSLTPINADWYIKEVVRKMPIHNHFLSFILVGSFSLLGVG